MKAVQWKLLARLVRVGKKEFGPGKGDHAHCACRWMETEDFFDDGGDVVQFVNDVRIGFEKVRGVGWVGSEDGVEFRNDSCLSLRVAVELVEDVGRCAGSRVVSGEDECFEAVHDIDADGRWHSSGTDLLTGGLEIFLVRIES